MASTTDTEYPVEPDGEDLDTRIQRLRDELAHAEPGSADELLARDGLVRALLERSEDGDRAEPGQDLPQAGDLDKAIAQAELLIAAAPPGHWARASVLPTVGFAFSARAEGGGKPTERDTAIAYLTEAVASPDCDVFVRADAWEEIAGLLLDRWSCEAPDGHDPADLDAAVTHMRDSVELAETLADADDPRVAYRHAELGRVYTVRYQNVPAGAPGERDDLNAAITELTAALAALTPGTRAAEVPPIKVRSPELRPAEPLPAEGLPAETAAAESVDDADLMTLTAMLGELRWDRFWFSGPPESDAAREQRRADRDAAIELLSGTVDSDDRLKAGEALDDRYTETRAAADRDAAIARLRTALDGGDPADPLVRGALVDGGALLADRAADHDDDPGDLDAAIACYDRALPHLPDGHRLRGAALHGLGCALTTRGGPRPERPLLDRIIECFAEAWPHWRDDPKLTDEDRFDVISRLAKSRFQVGYLDDPTPAEVDAMIDDLTCARRLMPAGDEMGACLTALTGMALAGRAQLATGGRDAARADLERAEPLLAEALEMLDPGDPVRAEVIVALTGCAHVRTSLGLHDPQRSEQTIPALERQLVTPPADPLVHATLRMSLGMALRLRPGSPGHTGPTRADADLDAAIGQFSQAAEVAPSDDARALAIMNLADALLARYFRRGDIADVDAAAHYLDVVAAANLGLSLLAPADRLIVPGYRASIRALQGMYRRDTAAVDGGIGDLREMLTRLPAGHPQRPRFVGDLGMLITLAAIARGDAAGTRAALPYLDEAVAASSGPERDTLRLRAASIRVATAAQDPAGFDRGIDDLTALADVQESAWLDRPRVLGMLGTALVERHRRQGHGSDLDAGIGRLEQAVPLLDSGHPALVSTLTVLAQTYRDRGDGRSVHTGRAALGESAARVLLQTSAGRGLSAGRDGSGFAETVAAWCLADEDAPGAVTALELGRGLVLHAATAAGRMADDLRAAGHGDLAAAWTDAAGRVDVWDLPVTRPKNDLDSADTLGTGAPQIPDELRRTVLAALAGTTVERRLNHPPGAADIAGALRATGADALAYLLPRSAAGPGRALLVTPDAEVEEVPLPGLNTEAEGNVAEYAAALAAITDDAGTALGERQRRRWRQAMRVLCDWAWPVAIGPLLDRIGTPAGGRPPRVVLVPFGLLGVVPWHAARTTGSDGTPRYAVQRAVVSYAASGRQLIEAAHRPTRDPTDDPVIVRGDAPGAAAETRALRHYYDRARTLAEPPPRPGHGVADPASVLAELPSAIGPGASMLHLTCHGIGRGSPQDSHLVLLEQIAQTEGSRPVKLTVKTILRQAHHRHDDDAGTTIVMSACQSDLTATDHDEALTIASGFLAAGAATVVGTRWNIEGHAAALLSVMFHHQLTAGAAPADALRAAQLWMLDPHRTPPPGMGTVAQYLSADAEHPLDPTDPTHWAAFTHQGR